MKNQEAFNGKSCSDFKNVLLGNCNDTSKEFMGHESNPEKKISGIFHVVTNNESPFGRGRN